MLTWQMQPVSWELLLNRKHISTSTCPLAVYMASGRCLKISNPTFGIPIILQIKGSENNHEKDKNWVGKHQYNSR